MANLKWEITFRRLDLKYTWAIARNASDFKINAFVRVEENGMEGFGEVAPNIRYKETPEAIEKAFELFQQKATEPVVSTEGLARLLKELGMPNSLRFGIESAFVHLRCRQQRQSVPSFFGLEEVEKKETAYTIPIMEPEKLAGYFQQYRPQRFRHIKLKVNQDSMVEFVRHVRALCSNTLMIDANEAYQDPDKLLQDLEKLNEKNVAFVEQPFPHHFISEYQYLKKRSPYPIFADESLTDEADYALLETGFHGVNIKLMKAGGYLNGIHLLKEAKSRRLMTMVGCMVESGLGISCGLNISSLADFLDLDSFLILKEDPFPYVDEQNGEVFLSKRLH